MSLLNFDLEPLEYPVAGLILVTAIVLLSTHRWRLSIFALALQYLGVFILAAASWPVTMAMVKLIAGWIAGSILAISMRSLPPTQPESDTGMRFRFGGREIPIPSLSGGIFRLMAAGMFILVALSIAPGVVNWVPGIHPAQATGALFLVGLGLLHLGLTSQPFGVTIGLLTVFSGFEVIYAAVEVSALVAGLLAGINLSIALVGAFLLLTPVVEVEP